MDHLAFVWSAYAATAFAVVFLIGRAVLDRRAQLRALERLGAGRDELADG